MKKIEKGDIIVVEGSFYSNNGISKATREFTKALIDDLGDSITVYIINHDWDERGLIQNHFHDMFKERNYKPEYASPENLPKTTWIRWGVPVAFGDDVGFAKFPVKQKLLYLVFE